MTQPLKIAFLIMILAPMGHAFDWTDPVQKQIADLTSRSSGKRRQALNYFAENLTVDVNSTIVSSLEDPEPLVQVAAAKAAAARKIKAAVPKLISWLSHWEEKRRLAAADALAAIGDRRAVVPLARALSDPESPVRLRAIVALESIGGAEITIPLIRALSDTNSKVRERAIEVLGGINDKRALIPLLDRLSDTVRSVRKAAVIALGKLGDRRVGASMARMVNDTNDEVAVEAIRAMGKLRYLEGASILQGLFQRPKYRIQKAAALALAALGTKRSLRALVEGLNNIRTRTEAGHALVTIADEAAPLLSEALDAPRTTRTVAMAIVKIAREAKSKPMAPALLRQLEETRLNHVEILRALQVIEAPVAQHALLGLLASDDWELRLAALRALKPIADQRAVAPLLATLEGAESEIVLEVISQLNGLQSPRSSAALRQLSQNRDPKIAFAAASALVALRDDSAAPTFLGLISARQLRMRRIAIQGIARLPKRRLLVGKILKACDQQTENALSASCILALGAALRGTSVESGNVAEVQALAFLLRSLQHPSTTIWQSSVTALAAADDPQIVGPLLERIRTTDRLSRHRFVAILGNAFARSSKTAHALLRRSLAEGSPAEQAASAWALGKRGANAAHADNDPERLQSAMRSLNWQTRVNASASLARLRLPRLGAALLAMTEDRNPYVRANAVAGLGLLKLKSTEHRLQTLMWSGRNPWARINAYRALREMGGDSLRHPASQKTISLRQAHRYLTEDDPDIRVRHAMRAVAKPQAEGHAQKDPPQDEAPTTEWIGLVVRNSTGDLVRNTAVALITPSGLIKAVETDDRGQVWEEGLQPGHCFIETPPASLRHRQGLKQ